MTARELLKVIPGDWRDEPIAVLDAGTAMDIVSINLIETPDGNRVIVVGGRVPRGAGQITRPVGEDD